MSKRSDRKFLVDAMIELGVSQSEMGRLIGRNSTTINHILKGRHALQEILKERIALVLTIARAQRNLNERATPLTCISDGAFLDVSEFTFHLFECPACLRDAWRAFLPD